MIWHCLALVVGPVLPAEGQQIVGVSFHSVDGAQLSALLAENTVPTESPGLDCHNSAAYGTSRIKVNTSCLAEFQVEEVSGELPKATALAEDTIRSVLVSLSLACNADAYEVSLIRCSQSPTGTPPESVLSPVAKIRFWNQRRPPSNVEIRSAEQVHTLTTGNEDFQTAVSYWARGWRVFGPALDPMVHHSAFLLFFASMESVAERVVTWYRNQADGFIRGAQQQVLERLGADLAKAAGKWGRKATIVRAASDQIRRINEEFLDLKLERSGSLLGISDTDVARAKRMGKLRNEAAAHAGSGRVGITEQHVREVEVLARVYIRGYASFLERKSATR